MAARPTKPAQFHTMRPANANSDTERNIIDATARLRPAPRVKVLKTPTLSPEKGKSSTSTSRRGGSSRRQWRLRRI